MKKRVQMNQGILISLAKRMPILNLDFKEKYRYNMFGYYDGMDVKTISDWGNFRPAAVSDVIGKSKLGDGIYDKYTIKACYPSFDLVDRLISEYNLCYDIWEKDSIDKDFPFISCITLHLTKACIKNNNISDIFIQIANAIKNAAEDILKCSIYFSIGYADVIVLARSRNIDGVINLLGGLNSIKTESNKWISDLYTITGYERKAFDNKDSFLKSEKELNFSVSFVLKAGFSLNEFRNQLIEEMEKVFKLIKYNKNTKTFKKAIYSSFGNTDVIFNLSCLDTVLPALYLNKSVLGIYGPFNVNSDLYRKYITTIKVSVLCDCDNNCECLSSNIMTDIKEYEVFLEKILDSVKEQNLPRRMVAAIRQIMKTYYTMSALEHGFDVKIIIGEAIKAFMTNMEISLKKLENLKGLERSRLIGDIENAVRKFREYIETYLSDLYRSDRSFMEGRTMTHQSIGALTKLLFSYNNFINGLANSLKAENEEFAFVVVSGGRDRTRVDEIFNFLGGWTEGYNHLFIVSIPEISLFDISGTLFRLSHECMHCFGERKRVKRAYYATLAWVEYISLFMSKQLFDYKFYYLDEEKLLIPKEKVYEKIETFRDKYQNELKKLLEDLVVDQSKNMVDENESRYYTAKCVEHIKSEMEINFIVARDISSELYLKATNYLLNEQIELLRYILKNSTNGGIRSKLFRDSLSEIEYYQDNNIVPMEMYDAFTGMLYRLFMGVVAPEHITLEYKLQSLYRNKKHLSEKDKEKEFKVLVNSMNNFADIAITVMSECYADCKAANKLGIQLSDFLLAFVYETWDVDKAMPLNLVNILRVGVDLKLLFDISGSLKEEHENSVRELKEQYRNAGFKLKIELDNYFVRLNEILSYYQQVESVGNQIIKYLNECDITKQENAEKGEFQEFYNRFRNPLNINERIYEFLEYWKKLTQE